ncbi:hypothetical protein AG0111_0g4488 [Alternaria gaisen]|uniref:Uncharacterized protein n=1 Tax=Alternaria gaisen TaxID=167740 RepID=A0ACB6FSG3_9PLEO|nr:hypothetical protein AG0111_0g4488 [Alternaria gaisen]
MQGERHCDSAANRLGDYQGFTLSNATRYCVCLQQVCGRRVEPGAEVGLLRGLNTVFAAPLLPWPTPSDRLRQICSTDAAASLNRLTLVDSLTGRASWSAPSITDLSPQRYVFAQRLRLDSNTIEKYDNKKVSS